MNIHITIKEPVPHETDLIGLKEALAYVLEQYDLTVEMIDIQDSPTKGEWKINPDGWYPYCSNCLSEPKNGDTTNFCPQCGCDMRKGGESK